MRVCSGLGAVSSWQELGETGSSSAVFDVEAAVTFVSWDGGLALRVLCTLFSSVPREVRESFCIFAVPGCNQQFLKEPWFL